MRLDDFDFELPREAIAQHPVIPRDSARLLVVGDGPADRHVRDLPDLLQPGDLLVVNDTRVLPVRLAGKRGDVAVSVTLHTDTGNGCWRAFAKPGRRLRVGDRVHFADDFFATVDAKEPSGDILLRFDLPQDAFVAALQQYGAMPLPPYIRRAEFDGGDLTDYQTVYAEKDGAIAAPTAGLHFTPELLRRLAARGIGCARLTLHVGAGTFLPVKADDLKDHVMHAEYGIVDEATAAAINATRKAGGRIVAVGTTSVRLLESAVDDEGVVHPFEGETALFITPGFRFRAVDRMMTNFHLPKSTLFVLVCAFAGRDRMRAAYAHAVESGYRFYSYGDACLLSPEGTGV
ncbi:MAG: tRNA preQ1(34) S-adenosylmethionine ribosyltransferase-isomerase QueA [Alphaproteobacteria bacterium]